MSTWLEPRCLARRGKDPAVVGGGDTTPFRLDQLEDDLTVVFCGRHPYAGAASSAPGTIGGGATGSVVVWGADLLTVRVHPPTPPRVGRWTRFTLRGHPATFHVHYPDGRVLAGDLDQPAMKTELRRVFGGWTRASLTITIRVDGRTMFLSGKGFGGWKVRTADGRPVAQGTLAGIRVARASDAVERSVAIAVALSLRSGSYLPLS